MTTVFMTMPQLPNQQRVWIAMNALHLTKGHTLKLKPLPPTLLNQFEAKFGVPLQKSDNYKYVLQVTDIAKKLWIWWYWSI